MNKVICPEPGSQMTNSSSTIPTWRERLYDKGVQWTFDEQRDAIQAEIDDLRATLATARASERERCAKIIEQRGKDYVEKWGRDGDGNGMDEQAKSYAWDCLQHAVELRALKDAP